MTTPLIGPTIQGLIDNVRLMLRQPDPNNSNWSDVELLAYLNEAVRVYSAELSDIDEGYFTTTTDLDIVTDIEAISLPSDFFKIKVLWKKCNNDYVALNYRNNVASGYSTQGGTSSDTYTPSYEFRGNTIILHPTPNFSEVGGLKLEYIQLPVSYVDGADQMTAQISPLFRQVLEMYTVYKAKMTESLVTGTVTYGPAKENLADLTDQFRKVAQKRSKNPTFIIPFNPENC